MFKPQTKRTTVKKEKTVIIFNSVYYPLEYHLPCLTNTHRLLFKPDIGEAEKGDGLHVHYG